MTEPSAQLSHTHGETDTPLIEQTIGDNFDATVASFGDREALVDVAQGKRWTYAELQSDVDRLARALLAAGVAKGDRVGIWAPNRSEWVLVQYATAKIGAILVNINPAYRAHELKYVLKQAGISYLFAVSEFRTSNYARMVQGVRHDCHDLMDAIYFETRSGTPCWPRRTTSPRKRSPTSSRASTATTRSTSNTPAAQQDSRRARR